MSSNNIPNNQIAGYVFCSGLGTRLMPYTKEIPKPILLGQGNRNFLQINIDRLLAIGANKIYVNYSYAYDKFLESVQKYGEKVTLVYEENPIGQGKAICNVLPQISSNQYLYTVNGDTIAEYDNIEFISYANNNNIDCLISTDPKIAIPKNLLVNDNHYLLGCKLNEKEYFYINPVANYQTTNSLGDYIFRIKSLQNIFEEASTQSFLGIFGENDLAEIMIKHNQAITVKNVNAKTYYSVNTVEEYINFKKSTNV